MAHDLPARTLRLLSLLQARREWSGAELAHRLGVSVRTVRRDIDRLREIGYLVDSGPGHAGGYRLAAGTALPPLALDDDEAVATAVALRTATIALAGMSETAVRALAKLEHVLPTPLRARVTAIQHMVSPLQFTGGGTLADPTSLVTLAVACRDHEIVTFDYTTRQGTNRRRRVEPHALVAGAGLWYRRPRHRPRRLAHLPPRPARRPDPHRPARPAATTARHRPGDLRRRFDHRHTRPPPRRRHRRRLRRQRPRPHLGRPARTHHAGRRPHLHPRPVRRLAPPDRIDPRQP